MNKRPSHTWDYLREAVPGPHFKPHWSSPVKVLRCNRSQHRLISEEKGSITCLTDSLGMLEKQPQSMQSQEVPTMTSQTGNNITNVPNADITKKPASKWSLDATSADLRELLPKGVLCLASPWAGARVGHWWAELPSTVSLSGRNPGLPWGPVK